MVTGGGSAGHVIPAKPLIDSLLAQGIAVTYIGSKSGLEQRLVEDQAVTFEAITTGKLRRYLSFENLIDAFRVPLGIVQSFFLLWKVQPNVVFSKGGYVAFPVVMAAWMLRIPVVSHESDLSMGLANRLSLPFTHTLCTNFPSTKIRAKSKLLTGTPMRRSLLEGSGVRARKWLGIGDSLPVVVIVGGSLGADSLNELARLSAPDLCEDCHVIHVCGPGKKTESTQTIDRYRQFEFIDSQWGDVLALADVVVSRAGANSLYELLTLRKPNLLIPLPLTSSRGDQIENARMAEENGWSKVVLEEELTTSVLVASVRDLLTQRQRWVDALNQFPRLNSVELIEEILSQAARS